MQNEHAKTRAVHNELQWFSWLRFGLSGLWESKSPQSQSGGVFLGIHFRRTTDWSNDVVLSAFMTNRQLGTIKTTDMVVSWGIGPLIPFHLITISIWFEFGKFYRKKKSGEIKYLKGKFPSVSRSVHRHALVLRTANLGLLTDFIHRWHRIPSWTYNVQRKSKEKQEVEFLNMKEKGSTNPQRQTTLTANLKKTAKIIRAQKNHHHQAPPSNTQFTIEKIQGNKVFKITSTFHTPLWKGPFHVCKNHDRRVTNDHLISPPDHKNVQE